MTTTLFPAFALKNKTLRAVEVRDQRSEISNGVAVYIHIPFCHHRCSYCDFNIYAGMRALYESYAESVAQEIASTAARAGRVRVPTIYFGGGTPSLLPAELIGGMLATVRTFFDVDEDAEITIEANPAKEWGAGGREYFAQLRSLGVNRASLGIQSSHEDELKLLRRGHSFEDAVATYESMRRAGFENVNIDLIYGLPNQSIDEWQVTLQRVIDLQPDHISAYSLQVEERTAMFNWVRDQRVPAPDEETVAAMYEMAEAILADAGYVHYEISNWAGQGHEVWGKESNDYRSQHNLVYWRNEPYFGFGCGAHSFYAGQRYSTVKHPREYIRRIETSVDVVEEVELIDRTLEMGETMMLGLRLIEAGVSRDRFRERFNRELDEVYRSTITRLVEQGLLESRPDRIRLTPRGRLLGNRVFAEFLPG